MTNPVLASQQSLTPGAPVELFCIDLTPIRVNQQFYMCRHPNVSFGGQLYDHIPCELTDVERNATGEMMAPKFSVPNAKKFASALVNQYKDMVGAEVTRIKTFEQFLDGKPGADPEAIQHFDIFVVEQKVALNKTYGQWELRVLADTGDRHVPGRTAMKDVCPFDYPYWDPDTGTRIIPERLPCPYRGYNSGHMFTEDNEPTDDPMLDRCDHRVNGGCMARTPGWPDGIMLFGGFPGMSRIRL